MADMRRCIGSTKYGIEAHEAPVGDFPTQPSQKDGLGRMCKPHWTQYTAGLARDRKARLASGEAPAKRAASKRAKQIEPEAVNGETPAVTARRKGLEARLEKVGVGSDAGQRLLERARQGQEEVAAA